MQVIRTEISRISQDMLVKFNQNFKMRLQQCIKNKKPFINKINRQMQFFL